MYAKLGEDCIIQEHVELGRKYRDDCRRAVIGDRATIRSGSVIYPDVTVGDNLITGHNVLVRERTIIGDRVVIGTNTVIDGNVTIGCNVKLESNVYIPTHTTIGDYVFIGPGAVLTNDKYPQRLRDKYEPIGPTLEDSVTVGANATVLPGVRIGKGSMVAAGSVVTRDVPEWSIAVGVPAKCQPLPERLRHENRAKAW